MFAALLLAATLTNVTGVVTFAREGLPFCFIQDEAGKTWRIENRENKPLHRGDVLCASGVREPTLDKRRLATYEMSVLKDSSLTPPAPTVCEIVSLFNQLGVFGNVDMYGAVFTCEGLLRDINRRQKTTQLLVGEGEYNLQVELPVPLEGTLPAWLKLGSRVQVTGALAYTSIMDFETGERRRIENVELIPESLANVSLVCHAPFWTPRRLAIAVISLGAAFVLLSIWLITLRRMVAKRTAQLADSIREREATKIEALAVQRERLRLAADLHDGFQQYLAGAMFRLKAVFNYLPSVGTEKCREQLEKMQEALQHTQNGLRATLWALNEESEGPESLPDLLRFVARRMPHWEGIVSIVSVGTERKIARRGATSLLLILQEAVANAIRHGGARSVAVKIEFTPERLRLTVTDDGCGFDVSILNESGHYGLSTMERRITELGGTMFVTSTPAHGTTLTFQLNF